MPLMRVKDKRGRLGYRWGKAGKTYTGYGAKKKAIKQGIAVEGSDAVHDMLAENTLNVKRKPPNPLRQDPTHTATIRRRFEAELGRRFRNLKGNILKLVVEEDAFGLLRANQGVAFTANRTYKRDSQGRFGSGGGGGGGAASTAEALIAKADVDFPRAGETVDGLVVRDHVPNTDSIGASFTEYEVLPGIREVPVLAMDQEYPSTMKTTQRVRELADAIGESGEINPLIVAEDDKGLYIVEGGHRYDALLARKAKSFPALFVVDLDDVTENRTYKRDSQGRFGSGGGAGGGARTNIEIANDESLPLSDRIDATKEELARVAQSEYDSWEQDEEGFDEVLGSGGICDGVCGGMQGALMDHGIDTVEGSALGDDHAWLIAYTDDEAFGVDIPPGVYEEGGGYSWTKLPDVTVEPSDVEVWKMPRGDINDLIDLPEYDYEADAGIPDDGPSFNTANAKQSVLMAMVGDAGVTAGIAEIQAVLDPDDVVELEDEPHVTVRYGFIQKPRERVERIVSEYGKMPVVLGKLSLFQNAEGDVLKIDVDGRQLREMNQRLGLVPNEETWAEYVPHLTVAYLKPGAGVKYLEQPLRLEGMEVIIDEVVFSTPKGRRSSFALNVEEDIAENRTYKRDSQGRFGSGGGGGGAALAPDTGGQIQGGTAKDGALDDWIETPKTEIETWGGEVDGHPVVLESSFTVSGRDFTCKSELKSGYAHDKQFENPSGSVVHYEYEFFDGTVPGNPNFGVTGKGDAMAKMRRATQEMVSHAKKSGSNVISFTADEPSRQKLYEFLVKKAPKIMPGWEGVRVGTKTVNNKPAMEYAIVKKGVSYSETFRGRAEYAEFAENVDQYDFLDDAFFDELLESLLSYREEDDVENTSVENTRWKFSTSPQMVQQFLAWITSRINADIYLGASGTEAAYWAEFARQGYEKGAGRAFTDTRIAARAGVDTEGKTPAQIAKETKKKAKLATSFLQWYGGTKEDFLRSSFGQPETAEKLQLLAGRTLMDLKNNTNDMATKMSRALVDGLAQGQNPRVIGRNLNQVVDISKGRAEMIARTEIIRAHAEGSLDAMDRMGVEEVGAMVEYSSTPDSRRCALCASLDGIVLKLKEARGMIPRHPRCRCAWVPANVGEDVEGQKRPRAKITKAIDASIRAEMPKRTKRTLAQQRKKTSWAGADKTISRRRPKSVLNFAGLPVDNRTYKRDSRGRFGSGGGGGGGGAAAKQTDTKEFKEWFGDSKVVDENGEPLVVYHGTAEDFDGQFDTNIGEIGAHFGTQDVADRVARVPNQTGEGNRVYPVHLAIENPLTVKDPGQWDLGTVTDALVDRGDMTPQAKDAFYAGFQERWKAHDFSKGAYSRNDEYKALLKDHGYDGIKYVNRREVKLPQDLWESSSKMRKLSDEEFLKRVPEASVSWIALEPTQIKSATGNKGTFDPNDSVITNRRRVNRLNAIVINRLRGVKNYNPSQPRGTDGRWGGGGGGAAAAVEFQSGAYGSQLGGYGAIQGYVREGKVPKVSTPEEMDQVVSALDTVFKPAEKDLVLHRGIRDADKVISSAMKPGDVIVDPGFISTSTDPKVGKRFAEKLGFRDETAVLKIKVPKGAPAVRLSDVTGDKKAGLGSPEKEYLLPRGSQFKITKIRRGKRSPGGRQLAPDKIELEVVNAPVANALVVSLDGYLSTDNRTYKRDSRGRFGSGGGGGGGGGTRAVVTETNHKDAAILVSQGVREGLKPRINQVEEFAPGRGLENDATYVSDPDSNRGSFGDVRIHIDAPSAQLDLPQEQKQIGWTRDSEISGLEHALASENGGVIRGDVPPSAVTRVEVSESGGWKSMPSAEYLEQYHGVTEPVPRLPSIPEYSERLHGMKDKLNLQDRHVDQTVGEYARADLKTKAYFAEELDEASVTNKYNAGQPRDSRGRWGVGGGGGGGGAIGPDNFTEFTKGLNLKQHKRVVVEMEDGTEFVGRPLSRSMDGSSFMIQGKVKGQKGKSEIHSFGAERDGDKITQIRAAANKDAMKDGVSDKPKTEKLKPVPKITNNEIPTPSRAQRDYVEPQQDKAVAAYAKANGKTTAEVQKEWDAKAQEACDKAKVYIRVPPSLVDEVLQDGRYKSQFETKSSHGGDVQIEARAQGEAVIFGTPMDTKPGDRPIYGYASQEPATSGWTHNDCHGTTTGYGGAAIELKDSVKDRSTVTFGDSLNQSDGTVPSPIRKVSHRSANFVTYKDDKPFAPPVVATGSVDGQAHQPPKGMSKLDPRFGDYTEVQVHHGVSLHDVEKIHFPEPPSAKVQALLKARKVKWEVMK